MLEKLSKPEPRVGYCKVAEILSGLSESDAKILTEALTDVSWPAKALSKGLKDQGVLVSDTTILRHRRRECPCE